MKLSKAVQYEREQAILIAKLFIILDLGDYNTIIREELDENVEKRQKIVELIPEIRKYFVYKHISGIVSPEECKRVHWSIVKCLMKTVPVSIAIKSCQYKGARTVRYVFEFKDGWTPRYDLLPALNNQAPPK